MSITVTKLVLDHKSFLVNALAFLPHENTAIKPAFGIFTHGYTAHKGDLLNWASRLCEEGMASIIFDLPGHYLGSYNEVLSFEKFKTQGHFLFEAAFRALRNEAEKGYLKGQDFLKNESFELILGGHSLGALMAVKALELPTFQSIKKRAITVGLGLLNLPDGRHIFETPFYKSTLNLRGQLVSKQIPPSKVFSWIKEEKESISVSNLKIHMIVGKDDLVVTEKGAHNLKNIFENKNNVVTLELPNRLPHHMPELAATHIKKYLKKEGII